MTNKIIIHTLQFMKLYFLHCFDHNINMPTIDRTLIISFMKVLCVQKIKPKNVNQSTLDTRELLRDFYQKHYKPFMKKKLFCENMDPILNYEADTIITMYKNNIEQQFIKYISRFVDAHFEKKTQLDDIDANQILHSLTKQALKNHFKLKLKHIKEDILNVETTEMKSPNDLHDWIKEIKLKILPIKTFKK